MPKRLAQKLIVSLTILVVIVGVISGLITVRRQERQLQDVMILGAEQLSKGITSATWHAMLADHRQDAYDIMQTIAEKQGINRIRIFNREGWLMYSTNPADGRDKVDKSGEACTVCHGSGQPLLTVAPRSRVRIFREGEARRLAIVSPIYNEPACSQAACHAHPPQYRVLGVLDVALKLDPVDREVAHMQLQVFLVTGIQILLISVFIGLFTRYFVGVPIRQLIAGTKAVSAMELDRHLDIRHSSRELDELADSFNVMRERLKAALAEINRFTQQLETKVEERTRELKAAHQKLLQSDRLASLGRLAATVAHEINNPISSVLNLSMLMQRILKDDGVPPNRLPEFRRYLGHITNETTRVGRIVTDLLAFSRRSKPQRTEADFNKIIRTTLSLVSHKLKLGNVEVEVDLQPLPPLHCDPSQIQQVVLNLLLNGAEAMQSRQQGRLTVKTWLQDSDQTVAFLVGDTGEGIAPENVSRIFDPFFTTKAEGKGVGLGLAVTYGIVEAHGGDVEVKSTVGEGTTFTVLLPVNPREAAGAPEPPVSHAVSPADEAVPAGAPAAPEHKA